MRTYLALSLLLTLAASLTTYTNDIQSDRYSYDTNHIYSLGYLNAGDVLRMQITFPDPSSLELRTFRLQLLDVDAMVSTLAVPDFAAWYDIPTAPSSLTQKQGTIVNSANYKYYVVGSSTESIQIMLISIFVNGNLINKIVDMPRKNPFKLIYVAPSPQNPQWKSVTISKTEGQWEVHRMKQTNRLETENLKFQGTSPNPKNLICFPRYFSIRLKLQPYNGNTVTFSYQSDSYPCPYPPEFIDVAKIFEPCYHPPCPPNLVQSSSGTCICKAGLVALPDGSCGCPKGKVLRNGNCVSLSPCPFGFVLRNGRCICPRGYIINRKGRCVRIR